MLRVPTTVVVVVGASVMHPLRPEEPAVAEPAVVFRARLIPVAVAELHGCRSQPVAVDRA